MTSCQPSEASSLVPLWSKPEAIMPLLGRSEPAVCLVWLCSLSAAWQILFVLGGPGQSCLPDFFPAPHNGRRASSLWGTPSPAAWCAWKARHHLVAEPTWRSPWERSPGHFSPLGPEGGREQPGFRLRRDSAAVMEL